MHGGFLLLHLDFINGLGKILAVARVPTPVRPEKPQVVSGIVQGAEELKSLLQACGVTGYLVSSGELLTPKLTYYEADPESMVDFLSKRFSQLDDLEIQILNGQHRGGDVKWPKVPLSLTVCSPWIEAGTTLNQAAAWFATHRTG